MNSKNKDYNNSRLLDEFDWEIENNDDDTIKDEKI